MKRSNGIRRVARLTGIHLCLLLKLPLLLKNTPTADWSIRSYDVFSTKIRINPFDNCVRKKGLLPVKISCVDHNNEDIRYLKKCNEWRGDIGPEMDFPDWSFIFFPFVPPHTPVCINRYNRRAYESVMEAPHNPLKKTGLRRYYNDCDKYFFSLY
jgi:hypothetical protein